MIAFDLRTRLGDYPSYTRSFVKIAVPRISQADESAIEADAFWPEPFPQAISTFQPGGTVAAPLAPSAVAQERCPAASTLVDWETFP